MRTFNACSFGLRPLPSSHEFSLPTERKCVVAGASTAIVRVVAGPVLASGNPHRRNDTAMWDYFRLPTNQTDGIRVNSISSYAGNRPLFLGWGKIPMLMPILRISLHQAIKKSDHFSANGRVTFPPCLTLGVTPFCGTNCQLFYQPTN